MVVPDRYAAVPFRLFADIPNLVLNKRTGHKRPCFDCPIIWLKVLKGVGETFSKVSPRKIPYHNLSASASQRAEDASDGIRQSPRGERATEPTFGPSGMQERLNC